MDPILVTMEEAAALLGVSSDTVRRRIRAGALKAYRLGPRMLRLRKTEVERAAQGNVVRVRPAAAPGATK